MKPTTATAQQLSPGRARHSVRAALTSSGTLSFQLHPSAYATHDPIQPPGTFTRVASRREPDQTSPRPRGPKGRLYLSPAQRAVVSPQGIPPLRPAISNSSAHASEAEPTTTPAQRAVIHDATPAGSPSPFAMGEGGVRENAPRLSVTLGISHKSNPV
ncbi:hypothetical protein Cflav_PD6366 [Pedosphaera parvula Ellin514]|uniref:Uncharacterized protein n=1 Tax=Pedosphaera parvula (strain Ellin514) TaxID=320771 RepID=B9XDE5_PEDPL|nr:hypothetical protein Cflav_PD6366 [Pedosphaera parvula Ellin514]